MAPPSTARAEQALAAAKERGEVSPAWTRGSYTALAHISTQPGRVQGSSSMRHLLQTDGADDPFFIATPRELESAILQGRRHIVVTAHLDMTALPLRDTTICDSCASPLPEIRETMSIRVRPSRHRHA